MVLAGSVPCPAFSWSRIQPKTWLSGVCGPAWLTAIRCFCQEDRTFHELAHHGKGHAGLEHAAARPQRPDTAISRPPLHGLDQRRLADPGRPLDSRDRPGTCHGLPKQSGQPRQLDITLEKPPRIGYGRHDPIVTAHATGRAGARRCNRRAGLLGKRPAYYTRVPPSRGLGSFRGEVTGLAHPLAVAARRRRQGGGMPTPRIVRQWNTALMNADDPSYCVAVELCQRVEERSGGRVGLQRSAGVIFVVAS
jgi:hypothetical protein